MINFLMQANFRLTIFTIITIFITCANTNFIFLTAGQILAFLYTTLFPLAAAGGLLLL